MAGFFAFLVPLAAAVIIGAGVMVLLQSIEQRPRPLGYYERDDKYKRRGRAPSSSSSNRQNTERIENPCKICGENIPETESKLPCNHEFHEKCIAAHFKRHQNDEKIAKCPAPGCGKDYSIGL